MLTLEITINDSENISILDFNIRYQDLIQLCTNKFDAIKCCYYELIMLKIIN
jgi:hypothetical protein